MALSDYAIAAILGNFWFEGGMDPTRWEGGNKSENMYGYGLGQWTGDDYQGNGRRGRLFKYLDDNGYPRSDVDGNFDATTNNKYLAALGQIKFLYYEHTWYNNGREPQNHTSFNDFIHTSSTDLESLTLEFTQHWEVPRTVNDRYTNGSLLVYQKIQEYKQNPYALDWNNFIVKPNKQGVQAWGENTLSVEERLSNSIFLYVLTIQEGGEDPPTPPEPPTPGTYTVSITTDGNGIATATPSSGETGTKVTLGYRPNSGYSFDRYEVLSGGVIISNNSFVIGSSNVSIKVRFKVAGYSIPNVPYFSQADGIIKTDRTIVHTDEPNVVLGPNNSTVANSGCGPCCAAMAMSYIKNEDIVVSTIISKLGGYSSFMDGSGNGMWNLGETISRAYGVQAKRTNDPDEALLALKQGNLVMIITGNANVGKLPNDDTIGGDDPTFPQYHWTAHGHYILAIGIDSNGKIAMADPGNPKNSYWFYGKPTWVWTPKQTVNWEQITKAARAPGNQNNPSTVATGGAYTIFYVPEDRKTGSYSPSPSPTPSLPVKEEKGIKGLKIDWDTWKVGTKLYRLGEYVILKAEITTSGNRRETTWYDITEPSHPVTYTQNELKSHFGISYTKVNNGYVGKFTVVQSPLSIELGGTGASTISDLIQALYGVNNAPSGYDYSELPSISTSSKTITLPNLPSGKVMTVEARSETRGGLGSPESGDQAQVYKTESYDNIGEIMIWYDRDVSDFTNVYRLQSDNPIKAANFKQNALCAANHACFLANNGYAGYIFAASGSNSMWDFVKSNKHNVTFGDFDTPRDTNCINLCKMVYGAAMYDKAVNGAYFDTTWSTRGILESNILERIGFKKFDATYARNPLNLEIGDILIKDGHAAIVVGSGDKDWVLDGVDYNPRNGEVKT